MRIQRRLDRDKNHSTSQPHRAPHQCGFCGLRLGEPHVFWSVKHPAGSESSPLCGTTMVPYRFKCTGSTVPRSINHNFPTPLRVSISAVTAPIPPSPMIATESDWTDCGGTGSAQHSGCGGRAGSTSKLVMALVLLRRISRLQFTAAVE